MFVRVSVWTPPDIPDGQYRIASYLLHFKKAFHDKPEWHGGFRPGCIREFDCDVTELAEIYHQARQCGMAVMHKPCMPHMVTS